MMNVTRFPHLVKCPECGRQYALRRRRCWERTTGSTLTRSTG